MHGISSLSSSDRQSSKRLGLGGVGRLDASPAGQFAAVGIAAGQGHLPIDQNQGQRLLARAFEKALHGQVFGESEGLLCQVEAFDLSTVLLGPIHVGGEVHRFDPLQRCIRRCCNTAPDRKSGCLAWGVLSSLVVDEVALFTLGRCFATRVAATWHPGAAVAATGITRCAGVASVPHP